jgi:hypothetical protein
VAKLCVAQPTGAPNVTVTLDNAFVGHDFPSGAAHDRRVWVELHASSNGMDLFTSGTTIDQPGTWVMRSQLLDGSNQPVTFLWEALGISFDPNATPAEELPPATTNVVSDPAYIHNRSFLYTTPPVDDVTMIVHATPIGADVLANLVSGGELDASIPPLVPTYDLTGTKLEWKLANGYGCVP